jgi:mono/diheme cytochrome c family protein
MVVNFLVLIVVIVLAIGAGWLTVKAVRARRVWVKIAGGLPALILTLVLAALAFFGGKGMVAKYFPGADPAPDLAVAGTPEQIARGQYLTNIGCIPCHGTYANGIDEDPEFPLAGGNDFHEFEEGFPPIGQVVTENLTPGGKLAGYTDGEIFRAIRHGVGQDGQRLAFMGLLPFGQMSDDDLEAIIAFLRSEPAVTSDGPTGSKINFLGMVFSGAGLLPAAEERPAHITAPEAGPTAAYGKYVATFGECRGCHGPDMTGTPASLFGPAEPNPRPLVSSLTVDGFIQMMRSGVRPGNNPFPDAMPWQNAAKMDDSDLHALYAYLTTAP